MNDIKRWSIAELRYAGGAEHDIKYVSEVDYGAVSAELAALKASFDELASLVGFSEDRLKQTGDSPMDCARQLTGLTGGNGDFDQSALAAVLQAELDMPERLQESSCWYCKKPGANYCAAHKPPPPMPG